mgnify:CR=1 FL=1
MLEVYFCDFSVINDSDCERLRDKIAFHFNDKDSLKRKDSVCAKAMLCQVLDESFNIKSFVVDCEEDGKPYLVGDEICFNLSHSDNIALCSVSGDVVGCDVEKIRPYNPKLAKRFFTTEEFSLLEKSDNPDLLFTRLWTMKESILKCLGSGLSGGLSEYDFSPFINKNYFMAHNLCFNVFEFPEYVICVCSKVNEKLTCPVKIEISVHK